MIQIRCKDLQVGYEGKAVSPKLNFCVKEGEYFCVVGENGAGKSTLMKTLLQLQKSVGGEIHFENEFDLLQIGYLPQQTMIQKDFPASVRKIILSGCHKENRWNPFYTAKQKKMALDAMRIMNIEHLDKRCYRELSGGQQQRVLFPISFCMVRIDRRNADCIVFVIDWSDTCVKTVFFYWRWIITCCIWSNGNRYDT